MQAPWLLVYLASNQREAVIKLAAERRAELAFAPREPGKRGKRGKRGRRLMIHYGRGFSA